MRALLTLAVLAVLGACSTREVTSPDYRVLPAGQYAFTTVYPLDSVVRYETGTLNLATVTADSIHGTVFGNGHVPDAPAPWEAPIGVGAWNVDGYIIHAVAPDGIYVWHLRREGAVVLCSGQFLHNSASGLQRYPTTCTVQRAG